MGEGARSCLELRGKLFVNLCDAFCQNLTRARSTAKCYSNPFFEVCVLHYVSFFLIKSVCLGPHAENTEISFWEALTACVQPLLSSQWNTIQKKIWLIKRNSSEWNMDPRAGIIHRFVICVIAHEHNENCDSFSGFLYVIWQYFPLFNFFSRSDYVLWEQHSHACSVVLQVHHQHCVCDCQRTSSLSFVLRSFGSCSQSQETHCKPKIVLI